MREKAPQDENLNETLEKVFRNIESSAQGHDSEDDLKGLFDDLDVNSNKLGGTVEKRNAKLVKLLNLKFARVLGKENVRQGFFGQEINITTYNLCRINMFLHDIGHGDTLIEPLPWDDEPCVMYRSGAERKIRKYLIDNSYVEPKDTREKIDKIIAEIEGDAK